MHAYAVPGRGGRIVVSTGMLRTLSGAQRRALLAHEHAHLRYHHHRYAQLARLAAAANPLMLPVALAVDQAIERWADSAAAQEVGDPAIVAHALGLAVFARPRFPPQALSAARNDALERILDLFEPPRRRARIGVVLAVASAMCWVRHSRHRALHPWRYRTRRSHTQVTRPNQGSLTALGAELTNGPYRNRQRPASLRRTLLVPPGLRRRVPAPNRGLHTRPGPGS